MTGLEHYNYWIVIALMMSGLYALIARGNLIRKLIGLNIFQASVFLLYISVGFVRDGAGHCTKTCTRARCTAERSDTSLINWRIRIARC